MTPFQRTTRLSAVPWFGIADYPWAAGWWTGYVLIHLLSIILVARRLFGTLEQPANLAVCVVVAATTAGMILILRRWQAIALPIPLSNAARYELGLSGILSIPCLLIMLAISMSGVSLPGIILSWSVIAAVESSWWTQAVGQWRSAPQSNRHSATPTQPGGEPANGIGPVRDSTSFLAVHDEPAMLSEGVTQQLTRADGPDGLESVDGWLRVTFESQERQKSAHVAFCPPLSSKPEFEIEQVDGPLAAVEIGQLETFGVRLEVRLEKPASQKSSIVCQFEARG